MDERLLECIQAGDIRILRVAWLRDTPPDYRMERRQDLETLEKMMNDRSLAPLLSPKEAVALISRGTRCVGALTYGWLTAGNPDPEGARLAVIRKALASHLAHLEHHVCSV